MVAPSSESAPASTCSADRDRPVALVTGASRRAGIGAAIVRALAAGGCDVAFTTWATYDGSARGCGVDEDGPAAISASVEAAGGRALAIEADLADVATATTVFDGVEAALGPVEILVLNHCECETLSLLGATPAAMERHFAVNVTANLQLIQELARRYPGGERGRIVALTSDHTAGNVPYGVTKGALERLITAAAVELGPLGIRANAVNPGGTDTGWMTDEIRARTLSSVRLGRIGTPDDAARLVAFLCSEEGGWITGQLLYSNGGARVM